MGCQAVETLRLAEPFMGSLLQNRFRELTSLCDRYAV